MFTASRNEATQHERRSGTQLLLPLLSFAPAPISLALAVDCAALHGKMRQIKLDMLTRLRQRPIKSFARRSGHRLDNARLSYSSLCRSLVRTLKSSRVVVSPVTVPPAGDFLEQSAHDFAAARFWQRFGKANFVRLGDRSDDAANVAAQLFAEFRGGLKSVLQRDKRDHALALDFVGPADDRGFGDGFVWLTSALSISEVPSRWPATFSTSSMRPTIQK